MSRETLAIDKSIVFPGIDLLAPVRKGLKLMATVFTNAGAAVVTNCIFRAERRPRTSAGARARPRQQ